MAKTRPQTAPAIKTATEVSLDSDEENVQVETMTKARPITISPHNIGRLPPPAMLTKGQPEPMKIPPPKTLPLEVDVMEDDEIADLTQGHVDDDVVELSKLREKNRRSQHRSHRRRKPSASPSESSSRSRTRTKNKSKHHKRRKPDRSFIPLKENEVPDDHVLIKTSYGYYIVPKYDEMPLDQQQIHRETFVAKFRILNDHWKGMGITFDLPKPEESLSAIHVRYKQAVKYVNARSGASISRIFLILGWLAFEVIAINLNIPAAGYTKFQISMYDLYQTQMVELGEIGGFGQDWHPITKVMVMSSISAALFIAVAYFFGNGNNPLTVEIMRMAGQFIMGQNVRTDTNRMGVPAPMDPPSTAALGGLGGLGGIGDMLGNMMGGNGGNANPMGGMDFGEIIGNIGNMFTNNLQNNRANGNNAGSGGGGLPPRRNRQTRGPSLRR